MCRVDSRRGSDCEDRRTFECPDCGAMGTRTRWRPFRTADDERIFVSGSVAVGMADDQDSPGVVRRVYRTVTPGYKSHTDSGMNSVGWIIFLVLLALFLPLLPFLLIVWVVTKVLDYLAAQRGPSEETET